MDRRGLVYGGHHSSKRAAHSIVQREIDLRETAKAAGRRSKAHDDQKAIIDSLTAPADRGPEQMLEQCRADVLTATQTLASVQAEQRNAQRNVADVGNRLSGWKASSPPSSTPATRRMPAGKGPDGPRGGRCRRRRAQREKIRQLETRIVEVRTDRDVKRETLAQARLELAERRQKVEVIDRGLARWERRRQQLSELLVQRQTGDRGVDRADGRTRARSRGAKRSRAAQLAETFGVTREQVERCASNWSTSKRGINGLEVGAARGARRVESAHEDLSAQEVKLAENRQRAQFLIGGSPAGVSDRRRRSTGNNNSGTPTTSPRGIKPLDLDEEDEEEVEGRRHPCRRSRTAAGPLPRKPPPKRSPQEEGKGRAHRGRSAGARFHRLDLRLSAEVEALAPAAQRDGGGESRRNRGIRRAEAAARFSREPGQRSHHREGRAHHGDR